MRGSRARRGAPAGANRLGERPVRLWNELELIAAEELPGLLDELVDVGHARCWLEEPRPLRRLEKAAGRSSRLPSPTTRAWLRDRTR